MDKANKKIDGLTGEQFDKMNEAMDESDTVRVRYIKNYIAKLKEGG